MRDTACQNCGETYPLARRRHDECKRLLCGYCLLGDGRCLACESDAAEAEDAMTRARERMEQAAPDLYAALKTCFWILKEQGFRSPVSEDAYDAAMQAAHDAITKAEEVPG